MDISSIGSAAANAAPRPTPEPKPEPVKDEKAETPAVAKSEDQATPPPKKNLGTNLDISV